MNCEHCKRSTTTFITVQVWDYSGPGPHPANGCLGVWRDKRFAYCNRHEKEVRTIAEGLGHVRR